MEIYQQMEQKPSIRRVEVLLKKYCRLIIDKSVIKCDQIKYISTLKLYFAKIAKLANIIETS